MRTVSILFLRKLLTGEKSYFRTSEVPTVQVPRNKLLSVSRILKKLKAVPEIMQYLPDYEEGCEKRLDRDFLFSVINKLDPDFFKRANRELDTRAEKKVAIDNPDAVLEIKKDLLEVLKAA